MRWPKTFALSALWTYQFRIDYAAIHRVAREHPELIVIAIGIALRLGTYSWNRSMWLDEAMLKGNVVDVPVLYFAGPLKSHQMAPIGFLIIERAIASLVGSRNMVLRVLPLACGIGALFLFRRVARMILPRRAALIALVLFAFSDDLIYYSSEFKPYSLDVLVGLAITLATLAALGRRPTVRLVVWLSVLAAAAPWFSFPSAFVVAGCGVVLVMDAALAGRGGAALTWSTVGAVWLANFILAHRASQTQLALETPMYGFWDFAFLPLTLPPTRDGLLRSAGLLLEVFVNPLNLLAPAESQLGVLLPLSLLIAGGVSLARRSTNTFLLLICPLAFALVASVIRRYPFHGRLILELVPALFLLIAQGAGWLARCFPTRSSIVQRTLLLALLASPCWDACYGALTRRDREYNPHGDLHHNVFIDIPDRSNRHGTHRNH